MSNLWLFLTLFLIGLIAYLISQCRTLKKQISLQQNLYFKSQNIFMKTGMSAASLIHNLINPLSTAALISQDLTKVYLQSSDIKLLSKSLNKAIQFINSYKNQITSASATETFSVKKELETVIEFFDIPITLSCPKDVLLKGDNIKFQQIFFNLIQNSANAFKKHSYKSQEIKITVSGTPTKCRISYTDNAGGIAKSQLKMLFIPFKSFTSLNMGFFICKSIVEGDFNGKVSVKNHHNGILVTIEIPFAL